jgi:hypothetical protein
MKDRKKERKKERKKTFAHASVQQIPKNTTLSLSGPDKTMLAVAKNRLHVTQDYLRERYLSVSMAVIAHAAMPRLCY